MFITVFAFAISAIIQQKIDAGATPNISWQILAYIVLTSAEVMISITCLEFSYTQAPAKMKIIHHGILHDVDRHRQPVHQRGKLFYRER